MEILFHNICYRQILGLMNPEGAGVMEMDMLLPLLLPGEGMSQGVVWGSFQWDDMYELKICGSIPRCIGNLELRERTSSQKRATSPPKATSNGLPPTPKVPFSEYFCFVLV